MKTSSTLQSPHTALRRITLALAACLVGLIGLSAEAQLKVGSNPTNIDSNANLDVEAASGSRVTVRRDNGRVGIGTVTPGNALHVDSGSNGSSGVRLSRVQNAPLLGTNSSGDIVSVQPEFVACTCGDIKASLLPSDHGNWKLIDGRLLSCTINGTTVSIRSGVSAAGRILAMEAGQSNGTAGGAVLLSQNQLPDARLTGTTSSAGAHQHFVAANGPITEPTFGETFSRSQPSKAIAESSRNGGESSFSYQFSASNNQANMGLSSTSGDHSHSFTTSSINGGVTQSAVAITNLPRLFTNYFVCTPL